MYLLKKVHYFCLKVTNLYSKHMESFAAYLRRTLSHNDFTKGLIELFGTPHMRTKILKKPEKATHQQLLLLAELTGLNGWELLQHWDVGKEKVSELEKQNLQKLADMEKLAAAA